MATTIAGPVRLPDGTIPTHGRVIFEARQPIIDETLVLRGPVIAPISGAGVIDVDLEADAEGTPYAVTVEYWSPVQHRLISQALPDVVPTGTGTGTLADFAAVTVPAGAPREIRRKRGETITLGALYVDRFGRPISLTGVSVAAAMRGPDGVTRALSIAVISAAEGTFEIAMAAGATASLPLGPHDIDVKFSVGTLVVRTLTATIHIDQEVTP